MKPLLAMFPLLLITTCIADAQDRDTKVRNDRSAFENSEAWIYDDFEHARDMALVTGKPLLVVFRCVP